MRHSKTSPHAGRLGIVATFGLASSKTKLPVEVLEAARDAGCPGFKKNGRIDCDEVLPWVLSHPEAFPSGDAASLKDQKLSEDIRRLRIANDAKEGKLIATSKVIQTWASIFPKMLRDFEQKIVNEWPVSVQGLDVPPARILGKKLYDEVVEAFAAHSKEWG